MRLGSVRATAILLAIPAFLFTFAGGALAQNTGQDTGQDKRADDVKPQANAVFVNGALAVPGAPANSETVPAKFSEQNAADDQLPTWGYTFHHLTAEQRRAIYESVAAKYQRSSASGGPPNSDTYAVLGAVLPDSMPLQSPPADLAAQIADVKWYLAAMIGDKAVLVEPASKVVVGVFAQK
jgi:hypothetical protein